jgi:NadR type nicotinamide-nucleotide adenylyltransferase
MVHGLVLGKFLPPHTGHLHLIRTGARLCDQLTVLVCTLERDPIPGRVRAAWMRELTADIAPNIRVVHVDEDVPQAPADHPAFWEIWADLCARHAGRVDVVFTSEPYGDELARTLGARHHLVDLMRDTYPVSGTAIRGDALSSWEMIPPPVRAHYVARVAVVGPESTGKSSLAARLAAAFGTVWVPEYGREHTAAITARTGAPFAGAFTLDDIETIATVQARWEDRAARCANRVLFCDTELLTTRIWSEIYFSQCPAPVLAATEQRSHELYLLLDTDIPWVDDGTRAFGERRREHFERIRSTLERLDRPYVLIGGSFEERIERAAIAVQQRWPALERIDGK